MLHNQPTIDDQKLGERSQSGLENFRRIEGITNLLGELIQQGGTLEAFFGALIEQRLIERLGHLLNGHVQQIHIARLPIPRLIPLFQCHDRPGPFRRPFPIGNQPTGEHRLHLGRQRGRGIRAADRHIDDPRCGVALAGDHPLQVGPSGITGQAIAGEQLGSTRHPSPTEAMGLGIKKDQLTTTHPKGRQNGIGGTAHNALGPQGGVTGIQERLQQATLLEPGAIARIHSSQGSRAPRWDLGFGEPGHPLGNFAGHDAGRILPPQGLLGLLPIETRQQLQRPLALEGGVIGLGGPGLETLGQGALPGGKGGQLCLELGGNGGQGLGAKD